MSAPVRRVRFVCVSDTHNASPLDGAFELPKGDVLVHAGDLTNQGTLSELMRSVDWIERSQFQVKIVVAGNHDIALDHYFYTQYGSHFHNEYPQNSEDCMRLLRQSPSITYLNHETATIHLDRGKDSETVFRVFGSPLSPARGRLAFGYSTNEALSRWNQIPLESDIVITHTPPKYHCDESKDWGTAGCEALRQTLWRVRPRLLICGHIHDARGVERVRWDLMAPHIKYKEECTISWTEASQGKKYASLDLSSDGCHPLDNDGGTSQCATANVQEPASSLLHESLIPRAKVPSNIYPKSIPNGAEQCQISISDGTGAASIVSPTSRQATGTTQLGADDGELGRPSEIVSATRGQGGKPLSGRCDMEALWRRSGRRETCVINAAIMASSWPHKGIKGKKYNTPIVVDIDLPIVRSRSG